MRRTLSLGLLSLFAVIVGACEPASAPKSEECVFPPGAPAAAPGTCPENCEWDGKACAAHRGVIIDYAKKDASAPPSAPVQ